MAARPYQSGRWRWLGLPSGCTDGGAKAGWIAWALWQKRWQGLAVRLTYLATTRCAANIWGELLPFLIATISAA